MFSLSTVLPDDHETVNDRIDSCNCCDDSRGDRRWSRRYSRTSSWAATCTIAATDNGVGTIVVHSAEFRIFPTSNGRSYSRSDGRVVYNIYEIEIRSVTLVAATDISLDDSRGGHE